MLRGTMGNYFYGCELCIGSSGLLVGGGGSVVSGDGVIGNCGGGSIGGSIHRSFDDLTT